MDEKHNNKETNACIHKFLLLYRPDPRAQEVHMLKVLFPLCYSCVEEY